MADLNVIRRIMPLQKAMRAYGSADKAKFPSCAASEIEAARPDSTFCADFCVACVFGEKAVEDTYRRCFDGWKSNAKMWTELAGALNHLLWFWHENGVDEYVTLFDRLWSEAYDYGCENFKGEDLRHFAAVLD